MSVRMPEVGGVFVQSESEVAAINMVFGASACGAQPSLRGERNEAAPRKGGKPVHLALKLAPQRQLEFFDPA